MGAFADSFAGSTVPAFRVTPPSPPGEPDENPSIPGFLGNLLGGVWDLGKGIGSLLATGVHDTGQAIGDVLPGTQEWGVINDVEGWRYDDILRQLAGFTPHGFHPTEGTVVEDFARRYGPLWPGGEPASKAYGELYENPLSYLLDVATIASGGATAGAKIGARAVGQGTQAAARAGEVASTLSKAGVAARTARAAGIRTALEETGQLSGLTRLLPKATSRLVQGEGLLPAAQAYNPLYRAAAAPVRRFGLTESLEDLAVRRSALVDELELMPANPKITADIDVLDRTIAAATEAGLTRIQKPAVARFSARVQSGRLIAELKSRAYTARDAKTRQAVQTTTRYVNEDPTILERGAVTAQGLDIDFADVEPETWATRQGLIGGTTLDVGATEPLLQAQSALQRHLQQLAELESDVRTAFARTQGTPKGNLRVVRRLLGEPKYRSLQPRLASLADEPEALIAELVRANPEGGMLRELLGMEPRAVPHGRKGLTLTLADELRQAVGGDEAYRLIFEGAETSGEILARARRFVDDPRSVSPRIVRLRQPVSATTGGGIGVLDEAPFGDELAPDELVRMNPEHPVVQRTETAVGRIRQFIDDAEANREQMVRSGWDVDAEIDGARRLIRGLYDGLRRRTEHERADVPTDIDAAVRWQDEMRLQEVEELADGFTAGGLTPREALDRAYRPLRAKYGLDYDYTLDVGATEPLALSRQAPGSQLLNVKVPAEKGFLYHLTPAENLESIRAQGLTPGKGERAVHLSDNPNELGHLPVKTRDRDLVAIRTRGEGAGEQRLSAVSPQDLEMLGVDGEWHRLSGDRLLKKGDFVGGPALGEVDDALRVAGEAQPVYFPHMDATRLRSSDWFTSRKRVGSNIYAADPHNKQMRLVLLKRGTWSRNPIEVARRRAARSIREQETYRAWDTITRRYGMELADPNMVPHGYSLVAPDLLFLNHRTRTSLLDRIDRYLSEGLDGDSATAKALRETLDENHDAVKALAEADNVKMYAVPDAVLNQLDEAARWAPAFGGKNARLYWDTPMNLWRGMVLTASPRWIVNNVLGNIGFALMQGVKTADVARIGAEKFRVLLQNWARRRAGLPEVEAREGSLTAQVARLPGAENVGHGFIGTYAEQATQHLGRAAEDTAFGRAILRAQEVRPAIAARRWGQAVKHLNATIEDSFREASFLAAAEKGQAISAIRRSARSFWDAKTRVESIMAHGFDEAKAGLALSEVNRFFGNYGALNPFERHVIRRWVFPFWSFYKHSTRLLLSFPFEYPARTEVLRGLAQANEELLSQYGPIPEWLESAIPMGPPGSTTTSFLTARGPNPFSGPTEGMKGVVSALAFPWQTLIGQGTGRNTFTGQPFTDRDVVTPFGSDQQFRVVYDEAGNPTDAVPIDKVAPGILQALLQSVPQYDMARDLLAGGNTYDTASLLDALQQRLGDEGEATQIDPVTGEPYRPVSLADQLAKFAGFPTYEYDLGAYQERLEQERQAALKLALERLGS